MKRDGIGTKIDLTAFIGRYVHIDRKVCLLEVLILSLLRKVSFAPTLRYFDIFKSSLTDS